MLFLLTLPDPLVRKAGSAGEMRLPPEKEFRMVPGFPPTGTIIERFAALVWRLSGHVGSRTRAVPASPPGHRLIPLAFCQLVMDWLYPRQRAINALIRRIAAGTLRKSPVYAPRAVKQQDAAEIAARAPLPPEKVLPRGFGWLCRWAPETRRVGVDLGELLNEPEVKEMVLAAPGQMTRLLGPMLTATGEARPDWFPKPPKRARRRRTQSGRPRCPRVVSAWEAPLIAAPQPVYAEPPPPKPQMAPWTGRGPGPCATLADYRSPFENAGGEHPRLPPAPPELPEWKKRLLQRKSRHNA
jgi:hypothetical protein